LTEYDDLLFEVKQKAAAFQSTAKKYIPRMYVALKREDPHISPLDARDRIEKDCSVVWSKRTILEALPDEAKNQEKQKAGRLGQKKHSFAAVSAAPEMKEIILDVDGRSIGEDLAPYEFTFVRETSTADRQNSSNLTQLDTKTVASNILEFEFSLPFEVVRSYMEQVFQLHKGFGKIFFHGSIDVSTCKVKLLTNLPLKGKGFNMEYRVAHTIDIMKQRVPPEYYDHRTARFNSEGENIVLDFSFYKYFMD
jgi:hypothetical protein